MAYCNLTTDIITIVIIQDYHYFGFFSGRNCGLFDENAKVEKFELSADQYAKRTDTVKAFMQRNKLGHYNEEEMNRMKAEKAEQEATELELAKAIHVGDRCEVTVPNALPKRGEVQFFYSSN